MEVNRIKLEIFFFLSCLDQIINGVHYCLICKHEQSILQQKAGRKRNVHHIAHAVCTVWEILLHKLKANLVLCGV